MTMLTQVRQRLRQKRDATATRAETITSIGESSRFRAGLDELADRLGRSSTEVAEAAASYLDEMVTVHSDALPDFNLVLARIADRRGFEGVVTWDEHAVERLQSYNEVSPLVMMTGHRSYLDFVVRMPFARSGFAREYRFAGANNTFWPIGSIGHQAGIIFIRRGFRDPVYTFALRYYVGWLTERRANFLWALEGGRSRTGKLLPPKAGLLAYVADAYVDGRTPDLTLVPATVIYEYLDEVHEYARYARGASKSAESLLFTARLIRRQRRVPPQAKIHLGIGEPVSLAAFVDRSADTSGPEFSASIMRAAAEVARRIEAVTPITGVALVLLALLERDGVQLQADELVATLRPVVDDIERRSLPAPEPGLGGAASVRRALDLLLTQGIVIELDNGACRVHPDRSIEAAYYRNAIVHHFAIQSIVEVALAMSAADDAEDSLSVFWRRVGDLRSLLAHDFFFPEEDAFCEAVRADLQSRIGAWEGILAPPGGATALLDLLPQPRMAPRTLAWYFGAHKIVADGLLRLGSQPITDEDNFLRDCRARAELELELGRLRRRDSASLIVLELAFKAAALRGLTEGSHGEDRRGWAEEVGAVQDAVFALETNEPQTADV